MATNKDIVLKNFKKGLWSDNMVKTLVMKGKITYDDYMDIVGVDMDTTGVDAEKVLSTAVKCYTDKKAAEYGYDDCQSVCSYINTGVQKFDDEGESFRVWRSAVWLLFDETISSCKREGKPFPTVQELLGMLPELVVTYK